MHINVVKELAALEAMRVSELRAKYGQVFGEETKVGNKAWLVKRIIWRLQALAEGDLSERARRRAAELAQDADLRLLPPRAPAFTADYFGPKNLGLNYGLVFIGWGIAFLVPLLAGYLKDATGTLDYAFCGSSGLLVTGLIISRFLRRPWAQTEKQKELVST